MKVLFAGKAPSHSLKSALLASGSSAEFLEIDALTGKTPLPRKPASFDLIVFTPKTLKDFDLLRGIRRRFSLAWLAVIAKDKWLKDPKSYHRILENSDMHDLWSETQWEQLFWFGLQRAKKNRDLLDRLKEKDIEIKRLSELYEQLLESSEKLIQKIEKDVGLASDIQRSLLPKFSPKIPGVELTVKYIPASGLGGDYYDIFQLGDKRRFGILLADSKTHGMAAALLSVLLKVKLEEVKERFPNTKSFVEFLSQEIRKLPTKEMAPLSVLYGLLDCRQLEFHYSIAGHLRPLLWRNGALVPTATPSTPPLADLGHHDFREHTLTLQPGDLLMLYTDGLQAPLQANETPIEDRIVEILQAQGENPDPLDIQNEVMGRVDAFKGNSPLPDDLTLIHFSISKRALYMARKPEKK